MKESKTNVGTTTETSYYISGRLGELLDRWQPRSGIVLMGTALIVGILTGIGAVLFRYLISGVAFVGYEWFPETILSTSKLYVILIPAVGGLIVGLLVFFLAREAKGHGVPEVMEAVALRGGRIRPRVAIVKSLASAVCIGSGGSAGREGPIVQIGSAVGSTVGQALNLSDNRISNLVACGAAAGIAATFNAPIAGVFFALEIVLGRFSIRNFSTVVIAAVSASIIGRVAFEDAPAFMIPVEYGVNSLWEFLFYPVLGILAAIVGVAFTRSLYWAEDLFDGTKRVPEWFKPAIGGSLLGVLALSYPLITLTQPVVWDRTPQVFNVGYEIIEGALANQIALGAAIILLLAKIIATCLTLGSGGSGGVFAPSLFMGAMLGASFELGLNQLFPGVSAPPGAYALVGMAAVFAASAHAPITAVIILFELTGDYRIILPLMLTVVVSTLLSQLILKGESIYTLKLSRRGVRIERGRDLDILRGVTVGEVMTKDFITISKKTKISELANIFLTSHHHGLMVLDEEGKLWGIVTLTDLDRAMEENRPSSTTVEEIATSWPHLQTIFPDESISDALARMGARGLGRLPVVDRQDPYDLLGLLWREGISQAYTLALTRREEIQNRTRRLQTDYEEEAEFVEISLVETDSAIGNSVESYSVYFPDDCVLVSIKRDNQIIIPHGDTVFKVGDVVTAFVRHKDAKTLFQCLHGPDESFVP